MKLVAPKDKYRKNTAGDTIVEVLIAIAVAAFAIGTSYAIANKSLVRAINARERNEALNALEGQVAALKIRYKADKTAFNSDSPTRGFVVRSTSVASPLPYTDYHFCLDEQSTGPTDATHPWAKQLNSINTAADADNLVDTTAGGKYNPRCVKNGSSDYFIDISAQVTSSSVALNNRTIYKLMVRWPEVGSGESGNAVIYYRL